MRRYITYKRLAAETTKSGLDRSTGAGHPTLPGELRDSPYEVLEEFVEVHSGSDNDRPQLISVIALAKKENAVLVVAKLDRLSRKVSFIASLMEEKGLD